MTPWNGSILQRGNIDVHAHMLPADCYDIPTADGVVTIADRGGELHLGDFPIAITADEISSTDHIIADMDARDIAVRVVSAPPYAFAVAAGPEAAADYATRLNDSLLSLSARQPERLVPLGVLPVQHAKATAAEIKRLVRLGVPGVAVPPIVGTAALADPELRHVLSGAADAGLSVLVHPMQQSRPGFNAHYLQNLIGNPVESATAIASVLLSGVFDDHPQLRIVFVHGAGAAPALVGRWDHGWTVRTDVSHDCAVAPSAVMRDHLYADSLTHSVAAAQLLRQVVDEHRILLGSDYPFDMADPDPVGSARRHGFDLETLRGNALHWLGSAQ
jgi:aminocarboxymuconate-semialdehyde decarboxylase